MIRFALACDQDHRFESWFQSGDAFDRLTASAQLTCPVCGSSNVTKSLMAPRVTTAESQSARRSRRREPQTPDASTADAPQGSGAQPQGGPLSAPKSDLEKALAQLRREVEANSEYVGLNFAHEARAIHDGDAPARPIYGEARARDARKLIEDGVPVAPLPFIPVRKTN